jgi:hypothetical protein
MRSWCSWGTFPDRRDTKIIRFTMSSTIIQISANRMISPALPYAGSIFNRIRNNIKSVGLPYKKMSSLLRLVKDNLGLRTPGVYRILSECNKVYTG